MFKAIHNTFRDSVVTEEEVKDGIKRIQLELLANDLVKVNCQWSQPQTEFDMKRAERFRENYFYKDTPEPIVINMRFMEEFQDPFVIYDGYYEFIGLRMIKSETIGTKISTERKVKVNIYAL
jgi:hypothetical protein